MLKVFVEKIRKGVNRKRKVDMCCLQEVRWRGQEARFVGCRDRRYKMWLSGNNDGIGGVGILVKEELCEKS